MLKHEFIELKLHEYRNNSIAHKILHISEKEEYFNVVMDIQLFRKIENIYIKFEDWFYNSYPEQKEIDISTSSNLMSLSYQKSLLYILGLMETDRKNLLSKLYDMFLENKH